LQPLSKIKNCALVGILTHPLHEELRAVIEVFFGLQNAGHGVDIVDNLTATCMKLLIDIAEVVWVLCFVEVSVAHALLN
jgi:hypothetical protein